MGGRRRVLDVGEDLLVELLARTETGVLDLDVHPHTQPRQGNHPPRQVVDFHGLAHIEDEDLRARAEGRGLHHQTAGLGNGHEESGDVGMRHRHRTALLDLLPETRNHGAVGTQHVTKTRGHEDGLALQLAALNGQPQRLHINLGNALGATHHIGGIHGLVGGNHHHLLHPVLNTFVGDIVRAEDVHEHGLAGVLLHQRHMLVGRRVEDHLRMVLPECEIETLDLPDVTDDRHKLQFGEFLLQLQTDMVHRGLRIVEQNQLLNPEARKLATKLRTDGAGRPRHHHHLAPEVLYDGVHRDGNLVTTQQILNLQVTDTIVQVATADFVDGRGYQRTHLVGQALLDQAVTLEPGVGLAGEQDGVDAVFADYVRQMLAAVVGEHRQVGEQQVRRLRLLRQKTNDLVMGGLLQTGDSRRGLVGDAIDEHPPRHLVLPSLRLIKLIDRHHDDTHEHEQEEREHEVGGEGDEQGVVHRAVGNQQHRRHQHLLEGGLLDKAEQIPEGDVPDDELMSLENKQGDHRRNQRRRQPYQREKSRLIERFPDKSEC